MIDYTVHVQNIGWTEQKTDGETAGTTGEGLRLEGLTIESDLRLEYQAHVENIGWQDWVERGQLAGTEGQGLRMEAFRIKLLDEVPKRHVWYRVHVENVGWTDWAIDGATVGSVGQALRMEAIEIQIVNEGEDEDFSDWYDNYIKCKLGDVVFSSLTDEGAMLTNEISDKAIEGGNISDHIINKPLSMSLTGVVCGSDADGKIQTLRDYLKNGDVLRYVGIDTANNVVIESMSSKRNKDIKGGISFDIGLKEVRIAEGSITVIDEAYVFTQANDLKNGGLQSLVAE